MPYEDHNKKKESDKKWRQAHPEYHNKYRQEHPQQYADYHRSYRERQKGAMQDWYFEYKKTMKCSRCPEKREPCLDFHHVDPEQKRFEVKRMMKKGACSFESLMEEVKKCIILCANCHRMHHWQERQKPQSS